MSETLTDDARHLTAIMALQRDYDEAEAKWEQLKDETAAAKKIAEAKARKLYEYNRGLNKPLPLFDVWRNTPVGELGLSEGVVGILHEHGLDTVGKVSDYTDAGKDLAHLPHMGPAKCESIRVALERFWRDHKIDDDERNPT